MTHKSMGAAAMAHFDSSSTHTWALERRVDTVNLIRLISLAAIWGASFLFMRMDVPVFGAIYLIGWRTGLAAAFLVLVALWLRRGLNIGVHWRHYLIVGTLNSALPFLMFAFAAKSLPASLLAVLNSLAPSFGAVLAAVWLKTRITRTAAAGLLLGVAGVALLAWDQLGATGLSAWPALLAAIVAPLCYSIASTYTRLAGARVDAFANAHGSMWAAFIVILPLLLLGSSTRAPTSGEWVAVIALGVLCTGVAYLLYFRLIEEAGPVKALTVTFLVPVFGVLWGVLFLDETVGWPLFAGGACVLFGTALANGVLRLPGRVDRG